MTKDHVDTFLEGILAHLLAEAKAEPRLVLRDRTENIALETTYCRHCGFNHYRNIGVLECVKCSKAKAS